SASSICWRAASVSVVSHSITWCPRRFATRMRPIGSSESTEMAGRIQQAHPFHTHCRPAFSVWPPATLCQVRFCISLRVGGWHVASDLWLPSPARRGAGGEVLPLATDPTLPSATLPSKGRAKVTIPPVGNGHVLPSPRRRGTGGEVRPPSSLHTDS